MQDLLQIVQGFSSTMSGVDKTGWKFEPSGSFSVRSFLLQVGLEAHSSTTLLNSVKGVWQASASPKAELLTWLTILERLNTKDCLKKFKIICADDSGCLLCNLYEESVANLFCQCLPVWKVWCSIINWGALSWACA